MVYLDYKKWKIESRGGGPESTGKVKVELESMSITGLLFKKEQQGNLLNMYKKIII